MSGEPPVGVSSARTGGFLSSRGDRLAALGVVLLAAGSVALAHAASPGWHFAKYPNLAARLLAHDGAAELSDASPLYLLLNLAMAPAALRGLQLGAAGIAVAALGLAILRARGPLAALAAALALGTARPFALYASVLEPDSLIGSLNALALALAATQLGNARGRPAGAARGGAVGRAPAAMLLLGGLLGLSCALRPTSLLSALPIGATLFARGQAARRDRLLATLLFALCLLGPGLALRRVGAGAAALPMTADQVVYQGNRPGGSALGPDFPILLKMVEQEQAAQPGHLPDAQHALYRAFAAAEGGRADSPWLDKTLAYLRRYPLPFAAQLGRKWLFANAVPDHGTDISEVVALEQANRLPLLPLWPVALLALGGLLASRRRDPFFLLLAAGWAAAQLFALLFFYQARYAVDWLPVSCCLIGVALDSISAKGLSPGRRAADAALLAAPFLLLALPQVRMQRRLDARRAAVPAHSRASILANAGKWPAARAAWVQEAAAFPDFPLPFSASGIRLGADSPSTAAEIAAAARARYGEAGEVDRLLLAFDERQAGDCAQAAALALGSLAFHSALEDLQLDGALLAADCARARPRDALALVRGALERQPGSLGGLSRAIAIAHAHPELGADAAPWLDELFALHDAVSAHYALARERRAWGDAAGALDDADWLLARFPPAAPFAQFERAQALLDLGRGGEALKAYAESLPAHVYLYGSNRFDSLIDASSAAHPEDADLTRIALAHWIRVGDQERVRALIAAHPGLVSR